MSQTPVRDTTPCEYAAILYHARLNPSAPAVLVQGATISYAEFCAHIERVTRRLHQCAIPAGSKVSVHLKEGYFHWLVVLALSRLGLASASVSTRELDALEPDVVLSEVREGLGDRTIVEVSPRWFQESADSLPPFVDRRHEVDQPARIVLSSGTTGNPKRVQLTYGHLHKRNKSQIANSFGPSTRLLVTMGISSMAGYDLPRNCWSAGATVVLPIGPMSQLLAAHPNVIFTSPNQLEQLVNSLPGGFEPRPIKVYVTGSALSRPLNMKARLRLSPWLYNSYGSTEIGTITLAPVSHTHTKPNLTGYVVPPVEVEIVDEDHRPVPRGTVGQVRIRSECQVHSYLGDPEATARHFRDGWFYSGDLGALDHEDGLSLHGRASELMNLGGVKLSPERIEEVLRSTPGVVELAVFSTQTLDEGEVARVAVVGSSDLSDEDLRSRFRKAFPLLRSLTVHRVESIPRNEMGKVLRSELKALYGQRGAQEERWVGLSGDLETMETAR